MTDLRPPGSIGARILERCGEVVSATVFIAAVVRALAAAFWRRPR